jgi:hypothetical protein
LPDRGHLLQQRQRTVYVVFLALSFLHQKFMGLIVFGRIRGRGGWEGVKVL